MNIERLREHWRTEVEHRGSCPRCSSHLVIFDGVRLRKATFMLDGEPHTAAEIPVRRRRCKACRWRWGQAPDHVTSRGHFQPCVVERAVVVLEERPADAVEVVARDHGCHRRTLRRWIDRIAAIAAPADLSRALVLASDTPLLPEVPTSTARYSSPVRLCEQLVRALAVLILLEVLATHVGLEPPASANVGELQRRIPAFARRPRVSGDPGCPRDEARGAEGGREGP